MVWGTLRTVDGEKAVGRFDIEFEVANYADVALARQKQIKPGQVRRMRIQGTVDSGAARFVLPETVVKQLGLPVTGKVKVRYADGRRATRKQAEGVYVEILGRNSVFHALVEPKRETALVGAIVLEDLDFLVDPVNERLVPRDPSGPIYEIE
jgi:predicted aspartyl protease